MLDAVNGAVWGVLVVSVFVALLIWNTRRPAAVSITVREHALAIRMHGWDILLCCRRQVVVPLAAVDGVCVARREDVPAEGLRLPGTGIPGVIRAGSFGSGEWRDFWDARRGSQVLLIQTKPAAAEYRRIVIEVSDAHAEMRWLRPVLSPAVLPIGMAT